MSRITIDLTAARDALRALTPRTVALVGSMPDLEVPMPESEWTVGQAAAHVVFGAEIYAEYAQGIERPASIDRTNLAERHLSGDPVAWLLALYGRTGWEQLLHTQRVTVTNGDAALGAAFKQLLRNP